MVRFSQLPLVLALLVPVSLFGTTIFNFENQTPTYNPATMLGPPGAFTSLSLTQDGITVTISRQNSAAFDLVNNPTLSGQMPPSWGNVSLDPFVDSTGGGFIFTFSQPVSNFSIQYGDFDGDSDKASLLAYSGLNATGSVLASSLDNYGKRSLPLFDTISASTAGIESVLITGTSSGTGVAEHPDQSIYFDNIVVGTATTSTPEPASLFLIAAAGIFAACGGVVKRKLTK